MYHVVSLHVNALVERCARVVALQPIDKVIETWKVLTAEDDFIDSLEPVAYWCLRYQSPG